MSGRDDDPPDDTSTIGYGRPPAAHRFKPGKSGNPRGRPRKARVVAAPPPALTDSLAADLVLLGEAYRPIQLHEGGVPTTLSTVSAVYRSMAVAAVKGNRFAQRTFTERVQQAESRRREQALEMIEIVSTYKENWTAAFDYADRRGLPRPKVLPHPDDVILGPDGLPCIVGPKDDREQRHWDELEARAVTADTAIREQSSRSDRCESTSSSSLTTSFTRIASGLSCATAFPRPTFDAAHAIVATPPTKSGSSITRLRRGIARSPN